MTNDGAGPRATIVAAWITGGLAILGTIIGAVLVHSGSSSNPEPSHITQAVPTSNASAGPITTAGNDAAAVNKPRVTQLVLPLPASHLDYTGLFLDKPKLQENGMADVYYQRSEADEEPTIRPRSDISTNVSGTDPGKQECLDAIATAKTITPVRDLRVGTRLCVSTGGGGVALLSVTQAPDSDGTMKVTESYWPPVS